MDRQRNQTTAPDTVGLPAPADGAGPPIPVEVSARHVHLAQRDIERLFGPGRSLTFKRPLSQTGQFLSEEQVSLVTPRGILHHVAILGPARSRTQVELSRTDTYTLGLQAPLRQSGDVRGCPGIYLLSDRGLVWAGQSVMVAQNHIHMTPADAACYGVTDGQIVRAAMLTRRPVTFDQVLVRIAEGFSLAMHIDFDEANACAFAQGDMARLILS